MAQPSSGTGGGTKNTQIGDPTGQLSKNAAGQVQPDSYVNLADNAAGTYGVPLWLLVGIFGMETDFGKLVNTSSTGAVGLMQFEPSTAALYHYPLTNTPDAGQAQQQFDAAAHYLSDLKKQYGSWAAAVSHYSGGGYTIAQVEAKSKQTVKAGNPSAGFLGTGINVSIPNPLSPLASIANLLTSTEFWLRLGEALAGIVLLAMGLRSLTGSSTTPLTVAQAVRKHV